MSNHSQFMHQALSAKEMISFRPYCNASHLYTQETIRGAFNRLSNCKNSYMIKCAKEFTILHDSLSQRRHPFAGMQPDYYVSVESGIFSTSLPTGYLQQQQIWLDVAWVLIENNMTGKRQVSCSSGLQFPNAAVSGAEKVGFQTMTAGKMLASTVPGIDHTDPQHYLTNGRKSRCDQICEAICNALSQLHHPSQIPNVGE